MIVAARQVLLELASVLEDERDKIVFVGGTACALLFSQEIDPHEGTIDVDIALDAVALADYDYAGETLEDKFLYASYQQEPGKKYRWVRTLNDDNQYTDVKVELLAGECEGALLHTGAREVQGLHASVLHGLDLAFLDPRLVSLSGLLPNGRLYETQVQVCSPASLLAMKGIAIINRKQGADKDAMDIDYILRRYDGGPDALARVMKTDLYWYNDLVQEGLQGIAQTFASLKAFGPINIATEGRYPDMEERDKVQQGAFQRVQWLLRGLGIRTANRVVN